MNDIKIGSKIKFKEEVKPYRIKALNERFIICTKAFNLKRTVLYTIVDLKRNERGTHNCIFNPYDFSKQGGIDSCLSDLMLPKGDAMVIELSHRNKIPLNIESISP